MDPTMTAALGAAKEGVEVLGKIGALEKVLLKLKSNPDIAAAKLAMALSEVNLGYTRMHAAMIELGSLSFEPDDLRDTTKRLKEYQSGKLKTELAAVKGHCRRIDTIYRRYLRGWFDRILSKAEARKLAYLFVDLSGMDGKFLESADKLSELASQHATALLLLLALGDSGKASQLTRRMDAKLSTLIKDLSDYMRRVWELQSEVIAITRAL